MIIIYTS